jgi:hypothetical protein
MSEAVGVGEETALEDVTVPLEMLELEIVDVDAAFALVLVASVVDGTVDEVVALFFFRASRAGASISSREGASLATTAIIFPASFR